MTSKRRPLFLRVLFWLAAGAAISFAAVVLWLAIFFDSNSLKPRLAQWVRDTYGRELDIGDLRWTPFLPSRVFADKLVLNGKSGTDALLQASSLRFELSLPALLFDRLEVNGIEIAGAVIQVERGLDGKWNFDDLIPRGPSRFKESRIERLAILDSTIRVRDLASRRSLSLTRANLSLKPLSPGEAADWKVKSQWTLEGAAASGDIDASGKLVFQRADEVFALNDVAMKGSVRLAAGRSVEVDAKLPAFSASRQRADGLSATMNLSQSGKRVFTAQLKSAAVPLALDRVPFEVDWEAGSTKWAGRVAAILEKGDGERWRLTGLQAVAANPDLPLKATLDGSAVLDPVGQRVELQNAKLTVGLHHKSGKPHVLAGELSLQAEAREGPRAEAGFKGTLDQSRLSATLRYPLPPGELVGFTAGVDRLDTEDWLSSQPAKQREPVNLDLTPLRELPLKGTLTIGTLKSGTTNARNVRIEVE